MGRAPALLLDPDERLERLEAAGVAVTVVQHFDKALRETPYDRFIERIRDRVELSGFLMTPDAAFGFERRGTPATIAELGARDGFDVVVVPPFTLDGEEVRSSAIRDAIVRGDLATAARLARTTGDDHRVDRRPPSTVGRASDFPLPLALPPDGDYAVTVDGSPETLRLSGGDAYLLGESSNGRVTVVLGDA